MVVGVAVAMMGLAESRALRTPESNAVQLGWGIARLAGPRVPLQQRLTHQERFVDLALAQHLKVRPVPAVQALESSW